MNKHVFPVLLALTVACSAFAELAPPPPSSMDGVVVQPPGLNRTNWQNSALADYTLEQPFQTPGVLQPDNHGRIWTDRAPSRLFLHENGGCARLIFLGASETWSGAVGYTYSGNLSTNAYTAGSTTDLAFGDHIDVNLALGAGGNFDFWVSGTANAFSLFAPENSVPAPPDGSVRWTQDPLQISTYLPALESYQDVETWIASIDEATGDPNNPLRNYRVALQFYYPEGHTLAPENLTAVPEPSTYGIIGSVVLTVAAVIRRGITQLRKR